MTSSLIEDVQAGALPEPTKKQKRRAKRVLSGGEPLPPSKQSRAVRKTVSQALVDSDLSPEAVLQEMVRVCWSLADTDRLKFDYLKHLSIITGLTERESRTPATVDKMMVLNLGRQALSGAGGDPQAFKEMVEGVMGDDAPDDAPASSRLQVLGKAEKVQDGTPLEESRPDADG